jgi:hypothetical protein
MTIAYITASWRTIQSNVRAQSPMRTVLHAQLGIEHPLPDEAGRDERHRVRIQEDRAQQRPRRHALVDEDASRKPITRHATMNSTPNSAMFCSDSVQRSLSNSRAYCDIADEVDPTAACASC